MNVVHYIFIAVFLFSMFVQIRIWQSREVVTHLLPFGAIGAVAAGFEIFYHLVFGRPLWLIVWVLAFAVQAIWLFIAAVGVLSEK